MYGELIGMPSGQVRSRLGAAALHGAVLAPLDAHGDVVAWGRSVHPFFISMTLTSDDGGEANGTVVQGKADSQCMADAVNRAARQLQRRYAVLPTHHDKARLTGRSSGLARFDAQHSLHDASRMAPHRGPGAPRPAGPWPPNSGSLPAP